MMIFVTLFKKRHKLWPCICVGSGEADEGDRAGRGQRYLPERRGRRRGGQPHVHGDILIDKNGYT